MKALDSTSSATKSSTTTMEDRSEARDSCYYPGCRKDANCNCDICLASITATLDLMPMSIQRSTLTKLSSSNSAAERTPIAFKSSIFSPSRTEIRRIEVTPPLKSSAKSSSLARNETEERRKKKWVSGCGFWRFLAVLSMVFAVDSGFSWVVSSVLRPKLSSQTVKRVKEELWVGNDLTERLGFLQENLEKIVGGSVRNCSSTNSLWELNKIGLILSSRCTLYKSMAEEVSIWGWPLQTAGLVTTGSSTLSLNILSGRVTEWPNGKIGFLVWKANNSSWILGRFSSSAVQMDPNTWILEYRQSSVLENSRLVSVALEVLKFRLSNVFQEIKHQFLPLSAAFIHHFIDNTEEPFPHPT